MSAAFHPTALRAVNEALSVLGQDTALTDGDFDVNGEDAVGRKAAFAYDMARRKVLRDHSWGFARREIAATSWRSPTHPGDRFPHHAAMPQGVLQLVAVKDVAGRDAQYTVVDDEIHSASPVALVAYTEDVEDLDLWSAGAYRSLVLRLAADLAKPVTGRINERQLQEEAYAAEIRAAKTQDSRSVNVSETAWGDNYYVEKMMGRL